MSKSASSPAGIINLLDEPALSAKKIRSAVTDSAREIAYDPERKPGVSNMLAILSALSGREIAQLAESYRARGYGDLKADLAEAVTAFVTPFREDTQRYMQDAAGLDRILARGAEKARAVAAPTLAKAYERVGFLKRSGGTTS
jgi:tryptophanyl-tRNA synthetase